MKYSLLFILTILTFLLIIPTFNTDSVCDLELFILELKQDLEDNGILDCLRRIKPPNGVIETFDQKTKRLSAQWDSSCSFESSYDWPSVLKKNYGVSTLVDEIGEPVDHNQPEQADMCEIVRASIKAGLINKITSDVTDIPYETFNYIDCPGVNNKAKICAVNAISYYKLDMWTIMLDGLAFQIGNKPAFIKVLDSNNNNNNDNDGVNNNDHLDVPDDPGTPIDKPLIEAASRMKSPSSEEMQRLISSYKDFTKVDNKSPTDPWKRIMVRFSVPREENIQPNVGWRKFNSGDISSISNNNDFFIIAYTMISGRADGSRLAARLTLDDVNQISTRMIQGYSEYPSITTGFISQLQAGEHKISTQYRASKHLSIDIEHKFKENIITGVIKIPTSKLLMKKVINPMEIQLYNDNSWCDFPNLQGNIKLSKSGLVLVMYNIAMPGMQSHIVTRAEVNTNAVFESRSIAGDSMYWGLHNSFVVRMYADVDYSVKIKYRSPYGNNYIEIMIYDILRL